MANAETPKTSDSKNGAGAAKTKEAARAAEAARQAKEKERAAEAQAAKIAAKAEEDARAAEAARQAKEKERAAEAQAAKIAAEAEEDARAAAAARQAKEKSERAAQAEKTAEARINTAQQTRPTTVEAEIHSFQGLAEDLSRALSVAMPSADLPAQLAQNVQAVSVASRALAKGAQEASRACFELTQKAVRTNLEAFSQLTNCRSVQDSVNVQTGLLRANLQQVVECGDAIAQAHAGAFREAIQAIQSQTRLAQ